MRRIEPSDFLSWAAEGGIVVDPDYVKSWPRNLSFAQPEAQSRYWCIPESPRELSGFLEQMVEKLGEWHELYYWPKATYHPDELRQDSPVGHYVVSTLDIPPGFRGALAFGRDERDAILALMFCAAAFGWYAGYDVYVVPDSRDAVLMIDHHEAMWAKFPSKQRCIAYVQALETVEIKLPAVPPDETFKPVD